MPPQRSYDQGLRLSSAGRHLEAIACFEQALAENPNDTAVLFALGNTARAIGQDGLARQFFTRVLDQEPRRLEALVNLANLLRSEGQFEAAASLIEPALAREPASPELNLTLGSVWRERGDAAKAAEFYRASLAARPNYVPALCNLADILADEGAHDAAKALYDAAIKSEPGNPQARLNRAVLHLLNGDLKDGWRDYEARGEITGKVPRAEPEPAPDWRGGALKKVRLLIRAEQGVGDQIMFASLFGDIAGRAARAGGSVIVECEPRLVSLLARSFPDCTVRPAVWKNLGGKIVAEYDWLKTVGGANASVLMGSLPRYLRKDPASFPSPHSYLVPDAGEQAHWRDAFADMGKPVMGRPARISPMIGVCWRSGKTGGHRNLQYAPLAAWGAFLKDLPGTLVLAQYDATANEIGELESLSGRRIFVPRGLDQKQELDRTAAMLSVLDVLVSAPTAVSWLGASTGVRTLKVLYDTSWTAFGQDHEPLAPSCLCVMPKIRGDWQDTFAKAHALIAQP